MSKYTIIRVFTLLLIIVFFGSCSDELLDPALANQIAQPTDPNNGGGGSGGGSATGNFIAKIDGTDFSSQTTVATYTTTTLGNQFAITGTTNDGKSVSIQILNPSVATFPASFAGTNLLLLQYQDIALGANGMFSSYNSSSNASVGTITITTFDLVTKKFSATFSFTAFNSMNSATTKQITNGVIDNITFTDSTTPVTNSAVGTYLMTAFNTSVPTDLNNDGTPSTNQMNETACFNNMLLTLNSDNTFVANSKGIEIIVNGTAQTLSCFTDPDDTGTWSLNGTTLTLTIAGTTPPQVETYTLSGNTITATATNGQVVGYDTVSGAPAYLNADITVIYTKQ